MCSSIQVQSVLSSAPGHSPAWQGSQNIFVNEAVLVTVFSDITFVFMLKEIIYFLFKK